VFFEPILKGLADANCRFVVVGSVGRALVGESVVPRDLDIVADASPDARAGLVSALDRAGGFVRNRLGLVRIGAAVALPWRWGWTTTTMFGDVDVVTRFADGSGFDDHRAIATIVHSPYGTPVWCHPTSRPL
jgi:hypothetical protein